MHGIGITRRKSGPAINAHEQTLYLDLHIAMLRAHQVNLKRMKRRVLGVADLAGLRHLGVGNFVLFQCVKR